MTSQEITKELESLSEYHLRLVRKQGEVLICQTKLGTLNFTYENKIYTLTQCGFEPKTIASGTKKIVKQALIDSYSVA
jgi:hypothetical protein